MFSTDEIEVVVNDAEIQALYQKYCILAYKSPNRIPIPLKLRTWVLNISLGESQGFSLKQLVTGVIEAAIYTYSYTLEEHIIKANEDSEQRLHKLPSDLQEKVKQNNKALSVSFNKENTPQPLDLSLEQQFNLTSFNSQVELMSMLQVKELIKMLYKQMLLKDNLYKKLLKNEVTI